MDDLTTRIQRYADNLIAAYPDVTPGEVMAVRRAQTRLRPVLVAAAAAVIVLLAVGGFALLVNRSDSPVVNSTTTLPAPTTTLVPTTAGQSTTTTGPTTTTEVAAPLPVITWTRIDDPVFDGPTDQSGLSVRHIGSAFYLVGNDLENKSGMIWRSEDGYTWERFDDLDVFGGPPGVHQIYDIAGNDNIVVALGLEANDAYLEWLDNPPYANPEGWSRGVVWVSEDDGHTWTRLSHEDAFGMSDSWGPGSVMATADGFIGFGSEIWRSSDGLHWTMVDSLGPGNGIGGLAITPSGFIGVGITWDIAGEAAAWWSTDGTEWNRVSDEDGQFETAPDIYSLLSGVIATDTGLVAVGTAGNIAVPNLDAAVWLSPSGHTWRRVPGEQLKGFHQEVMNGITSAGDLLIAVGESSNDAAYWPQPSRDDRSVGVVWVSQDDGATWSRMDDPDRVFGTYVSDWVSIQDVIAIGNQLVAVGYDGKGVAVWVGTIESS